MGSKAMHSPCIMKTAMFLFLFLCAFTTVRSHAALIDARFSGTVQSVNPLFSSTFSVGQALNGVYTFESTTVPNAISTSDYAFFEAISFISISIGGYAATSNAGFIEIESGLNGAPNDRYGVGSTLGLTGPDVGDFSILAYGSRLDDLTNQSFATALSLPTELDFADFTSGAFFLFFQNKQTLSSVMALSGELNALSIPAVPEPCTLALLGVGLAGAALARKSRAG